MASFFKGTVKDVKDSSYQVAAASYTSSTSQSKSQSLALAHSTLGPARLSYHLLLINEPVDVVNFMINYLTESSIVLGPIVLKDLQQHTVQCSFRFVYVTVRDNVRGYNFSVFCDPNSVARPGLILDTKYSKNCTL